MYQNTFQMRIGGGKVETNEYCVGSISWGNQFLDMHSKDDQKSSN